MTTRNRKTANVTETPVTETPVTETPDYPALFRAWGKDNNHRNDWGKEGKTAVAMKELNVSPDDVNPRSVSAWIAHGKMDAEGTHRDSTKTADKTAYIVRAFSPEDFAKIATIADRAEKNADGTWNAYIDPAKIDLNALLASAK